MDGWKDWFTWFTLGDWFQTAFDWQRDTFRPLWDFIRRFLDSTYDGLESLLNTPPSLVIIAIMVAIAWFARGWRLGVVAAVGLLLIDLMALWEDAMKTLSLIIIAVVAAAVVAIPIGIAAARSRTVSNVVKPILDLMQTFPALVYLIPAVLMFRVGVVPGIIATIIFAMPPGIRLTELGIRQVDAEVVEAGHAFGSPPRKILQQIQLPLAAPTIMAGVNQVIMLALSMTVLAGYVGGQGLRQVVQRALSRLDLSLGFEAGLSVVILAIYLDRVTAAMGARSTVAQRARAV